MKFEIKKRFNSDVAFIADIDCDDRVSASIKLGLAVKWALKAKADLSGVYLRGADLRWASLRWADLRWADLSGASLRWADLSGADLRWADLRGAYLRWADLSGAYLIDGGQRSDGWRFVGWVKDGVLQIRAGICRNFTITEARDHWDRTRGGTPLGDETMAILDHIERVAKIRGLVDED